MSEQLTMFDTLWETYKIKKPIRLIELFAGYGSQHLALKYLGANFESHKICEWAVKSIQAYKDLHCPEDNTDYSAKLSREDVIDFLFNRGISADYSNPMTREQIVRLGEQREREIYNNIMATHNLVSVCSVKGADLEINNKDKYEYIMTYSFPCQDLSLAGNTKGMKKGSGTRSGLLWEVERILHELKEIDSLPQCLVMENVCQVHGAANWEDFNAWKKSLADLGYCNFWQDLIATDYGIPQTRDRTFMVSILGYYNYNFPKPIKLEKRLKDLLEDDVDEKYFLSDKMIDYITADNKKWTGNNNKALVNKTTASTINTAEGQRRCDASNYICDELGENADLKKARKHRSCKHCKKGEECRRRILVLVTYGLEEIEGECDEFEDTEEIDVIGNYSKSNYSQTPIVGKNGVAPTVTENHGQVTAIAIKNATKKGYLLAEEGDGVDISTRMEYHRGTVQKGMSQTLSTMGGANQGVIVNGKRNT